LLVPALGVPLDGADSAIAAALVAGLVIDTANSIRTRRRGRCA
jgi:hypothetical protein